MGMHSSEENPQLKNLSEISGLFCVPAYQRGYRWGRHEIEALLDDIYDNGRRHKEIKNYCLQPIVIKKRRMGDVHGELCKPPMEKMPSTQDEDVLYYELIDGQQRLTTIYLIYHFLQKKLNLDILLRFSMSYETRGRSAEYLHTLDERLKDENIDFYHMYSAYRCIGEWFEKTAHSDNAAPQFLGFKVYGLFEEQVQVIWYDAVDEDPVSLFTRLNIGRIPLTNAELVKALLLERKGGLRDDEYRQIEIATQWDMIERELHDEAFWAFLTNRSGADYPTRIEFLLDLISRKDEGEKDSFHTFLHFRKLLDAQKERDTKKVWEKVLHLYYLLLEWFEDRERYHKVGYLVAIGVHLNELVDVVEKEALTKSDFLLFLNKRITTSLGVDKETARGLDYENNYEKCERLLLLFNVLSVGRVEHSFERYPFHSHKAESWSLEHIHAQHAEPLKTEKEWRSWLDDTLNTFDALRLDNPEEEDAKRSLADEIRSTLANRIEGPTFMSLSGRAMGELGLNQLDLHSIANLALLSGSVNSSLKNGSFFAKRRRIIALDRAGKFIPICTRRTFFKYYTEAGAEQMYLWDRQDQKSYVDTLLSEKYGVGKYLTVPDLEPEP